MNIGTTRDLAKSDTENDQFKWVMVTTTAGSLVVGHTGGLETTISVAPVGAWLPVGNAIYVKTTSTAVGLIVA